MPERYTEAIMKYLAQREGQPIKQRQLARQMGIEDQQYGSFRQSVKLLRDQGRVVLGSGNALTLPEISKEVIGQFRGHAKGFGFVLPDSPNAHGDLFIPPDATGGAMTGDRVRATVHRRGMRDGEKAYGGRIVEILQRGNSRFAGTLEHAGQAWFVLPDGKAMTSPIIVRDLPTYQTRNEAGEIVAGAPSAGTKVVVEITEFPDHPGDLPEGVIDEVLGEPKNIDVETLAVIRAYGLADVFPEEVMAEAREVVDRFDPDDPAELDHREDLTDELVVTIDPDTARDYDDAISLTQGKKGGYVLGVHIADVSHFVKEGGALDAEARERGNSVYFPTRVLPMLPEVLSNGVCSLQEAQKRLCKSAFIQYDAKGNRTGFRVAETVIQSARRLTYRQAQAICDGKKGNYSKGVVQLVRRMEELARKIEARRRKAGMLHLDLPDVDLLLDEAGSVIDAVPEDQSYTHTIIEMFMVEANDVVATLLDREDRKFLRRIHPAPEKEAAGKVSTFVQALGHKIAGDLGRKDIQELLEAVKGRPESYAVNLAILKTFQQAEYSPMSIGHFALASEHYCHFTSPIRRYPDLTIHRMIEAYCRGKLKDLAPDDVPGLVELGQHCSSTDREAEAASNELRDVLVLQFLETRLGETFDGVITGVTNFGIFVQSQRFLIEGLVRLEDLGDDWWEIEGKRGLVRGEVTGRTYRLGDVMPVRIAAVDVAQRQLKLVPERQLSARAGKKGGKSKGGKNKGGRKGSRAKGGKMKVAAKKGNTEQRRKIAKGKAADKTKAKRRRKTSKKSGSGDQGKSSAKRSAKKSSGKKQSRTSSGKESGGKKSAKKAGSKSGRKSTRKAPASGSRKRRRGKNR